MHISFLDPYHHGHSPAHRLDARVKLALAAAFILTTALTPTAAWPVYVLLASLAFAAEVLSELGLGFYLRRSLLAAPFVLAALPVLFTIPGPALAALPGGLTISLPGVERFASVALKSWISVQMAVLLAATTPFPEILTALRALRVPRLLVAIIGLMWRYLFVMADEALRLIRARRARSGETARSKGTVRSRGTAGSSGTYRSGGTARSGGTLAWRAKVTGGMAGSLMLRSLERSDRIYNAMLSRGFDGESRALPHPPITGGARMALLGGLMLLGALLALGYLL